ncbi:TPA: accessory Sec system glycosyltransferase Asp1, partial [Streptococcus agalactiae]|nr:accessory Sec system glycosyltransferase Asp1 [Streptococcus agalactiae]
RTIVPYFVSQEVYYCEQLTNWNRSLIYSIDKINDYTGGQLVERIINSY